MTRIIRIGIAKSHKYAVRESGDTVEVVERPNGGLTAILVDGQGSGAPARILSMSLTARAAQLIKEGVRDGAVARALNDVLFAQRGGKVSAALDLVSVDLRHDQILLTRNGNTPAIVVQGGLATAIQPGEGPLGTHAFTRPSVHRMPIRPSIKVVAMSDGVSGSGTRAGLTKLDVSTMISGELLNSGDPQTVADGVLHFALSRDQGRASDDMSVVVVAVDDLADVTQIRRLSASMPVV